MNFTEFFLQPTNAVWAGVLGFTILIFAWKGMQEKDYPDSEFWHPINYLMTYGSQLLALALIIATMATVHPIWGAVFAGMGSICSRASEDPKWKLRFHQMMILGFFIGCWFHEIDWYSW